MSSSKDSMSTSSGTPSIKTEIQSLDTCTVVKMTIIENKKVQIGSKMFKDGKKYMKIAAIRTPID